MKPDDPEADRLAQSATEEMSGELPGAAIGIGAGIGVLLVALWFGSVILVLCLLFGAVLGGLVAVGVSAVVRAVRGRSTASADRPPPGLTANTGPAAQRAEAGAASPST